MQCEDILVRHFVDFTITQGSCKLSLVVITYLSQVELSLHVIIGTHSEDSVHREALLTVKPQLSGSEHWLYTCDLCLLH